MLAWFPPIDETTSSPLLNYRSGIQTRMFEPNPVKLSLLVSIHMLVLVHIQCWIPLFITPLPAKEMGALHPKCSMCDRQLAGTEAGSEKVSWQKN